jgi:tRNA-specific 2-thiouridylase
MKIAVLVSGGVDSSLALKLLKDQGHELTAFYLKIWLEDELAYMGDCPWEQDLSYVRAVCEQMDVPLRIISLQKEYWDQVVAYTMQEIKKGRTPNPDVLCNQRIKFGVFFDYITDQYDKVATGHYAQTDSIEGQARLLRAPDPVKDQTYFLSYLTQAQLQKALFPIGHLQKEQVRQLAHEYNLPTKDRKDSQGICFLGKLKFSDFIAYHVGENPGDIREYETGKKLGTHKGVWFHTIGQRQGSGLAGGPWYVVAKDVATNVVYMSSKYHAPDKERKLFEVSECNWISGTAPVKKELLVKLRHGKQLHACTLEQIEPDRFRVTLAENDQGIAPGQFAVFYDNQICLGAGIIA